MKKANITELKTHASELLGAVKKGETVRIYDRDKAIADIVPLRALSNDESSTRLRALERQGILKLPRRAASKEFLADLKQRAKTAREHAALPSVVDALLDERRRGR